MTERIHLILTGGGQDDVHEIVSPEKAAEVLLDFAAGSGAEHPAVPEIASDLRSGEPVFEVTGQHGRNVVAVPETSPHAPLFGVTA